MGDCACIVDPSQTTGLEEPLFFVEITPACNNACVGCGNVFADSRSPEPLSAQEWCTVLDRIAPSTSWLKITGGEPTLHPRFEEIIEHIATLGIPFTLFTNARWLEPERLVHFLAGIPQLNGLLVSLHGVKAQSHEAFTCTPGSFDKTIANIQLAVEAGLKVTTSTVLTYHSCPEVEAIVALGQDLGADHAAFQRFIGTALPEIEPSELELQRAVGTIENIANGGSEIGSNGSGPKRNGKLVRFGTPIPHCFVANNSYGCLAGVAQATIDPWGNVRPCNHAPLMCGNLLEQPLEEIWHSAAMETWREMIPEECIGCSEFEICRGGCRATAMLRRLKKDPLIGKPVVAKPQEPLEKLVFEGVQPLSRFSHKTQAMMEILDGRRCARPIGTLGV
ncbi:MAG: radical SAM protein [Chloroflexi bacterium]|nr:radical SAM protein [Chloroflexota bacterium]